MFCPLIPTSTYKYFFRAWNLFCFKNKFMQFPFQSLCVFQYIFKLFYMNPIFLPILTLLIFKNLNLFLLFFILSDIKLFYLFLYLNPINIYLILQSIKLIIPSSGYILLLYNTVKSILSEFLICTSILITI